MFGIEQILSRFFKINELVSCFGLFRWKLILIYLLWAWLDLDILLLFILVILLYRVVMSICVLQSCTGLSVVSQVNKGLRLSAL